MNSNSFALYLLTLTLFVFQASQVLSFGAPLLSRLPSSHTSWKFDFSLGSGPEVPRNKKIVVTKPSDEELNKLRVRQWPTWGCEISRFPWSYSDTEICYIVKGRALIIPKDDSPSVEISAGDLCTFPEGLSCVWDVKESISKHYYFS